MFLKFNNGYFSLELSINLLLTLILQLGIVAICDVL